MQSAQTSERGKCVERLTNVMDSPQAPPRLGRTKPRGSISGSVASTYTPGNAWRLGISPAAIRTPASLLALEIGFPV